MESLREVVGLARRYDLKLRFMGTPHGILAVEETPGALAACYGCLALGGPWRETRFAQRTARWLRFSCSHSLVDLSPKGNARKECRDFLLKEARQVSLFTYDWYHHLATCTPQSLPSWDDERPDQPEDDGFSSKQVKALLAGGGYRVGKAT
jgi:hypothetical protein